MTKPKTIDGKPVCINMLKEDIEYLKQNKVNKSQFFRYAVNEWRLNKLSYKEKR